MDVQDRMTRTARGLDEVDDHDDSGMEQRARAWTNLNGGKFSIMQAMQSNPFC